MAARSGPPGSTPAPARRARLARRPDGGQATAELALGLPTLGAVVLLALWLLAAAGAQARAQEAARIGARAAARGDDDRQVAAWAHLAAPAGATVTISRQAGEVTVTVQIRLSVAGSPLPPAHIAASAVAPTEPAAAGASTAGPAAAGSGGQVAGGDPEAGERDEEAPG
ncbi:MULTISPECIES: TadE family type IV pilus minor pilin [unclassified Pseudofrankia]|uniref:TadE family type IV pilus minor pilin n=1 Tax=unclassified Pseudofrankia TaxID=2994372 RepID=UPI0008D8EFA3|nr:MULTISPECIES: TadE family type IV pilus minor pilin [unclassified Pseudofrankia]MDT3441778.1 TadE family type IV pilus minor pilin [Pseudofrankia sp. BMG5.37]OHV47072.1 hypothetical protein BCD48_20220 [Pseudofrankia sp. BMG5.36]